MNEGAYFAEIRLFAGTYAPKGWAYCDGKQMSIQDNQALYSLLGNQFGSDMRTYFCLPKLEPVNAGGVALRYIICIDGNYPTRD